MQLTVKLPEGNVSLSLAFVAESFVLHLTRSIAAIAVFVSNHIDLKDALGPIADETFLPSALRWVDTASASTASFARFSREFRPQV